ncbi:46 kDa FK506-binding nuclear protein-like isoform X1 [Acropora millepora]|uniref:46 kDa FK506-binding nuclear protein-like isoform X1 n=1 Tax=Acropora millepora TaxID=45264 RepID=UPI001CF353DA|nr:46 kDa FK506-binding nuclear protein-like isoform X1 [Acropora millepora]
MFWGVTLDSGKRYTQTVEKSFHLSMAALGFQNSSSSPVTVMAEVDKAQFALCTLQPGKIPQQPLDYCFTEGEEITFFMEGSGDVHLTGYLMEEPNTLEFEEDEETTADSDESTESASDANTGDESLSDEMTFSSLLQSKEIINNSNEEDSEEDSEDDDWDPSQDNPKRRKRTEKDTQKKKNPKKIQSEKTGRKKAKQTKTKSEQKQGYVNAASNVVSAGHENDIADGDVCDESWTPEETVETKVKKKKLKIKKKNQTDSGESTEIKTETPKKKVKKKMEENKKKNEESGSVGDDDMDSLNNVSSTANDTLDSTIESEKKAHGKHANLGVQESPAAKRNQSQATETKKRKIPGGIVIEDLKKGAGPMAKNGQKVHVYYKGNLAKNSKQFDACLKGSPFSFQLGAGEVIKGWDLGVVGMQVGGKRKLRIPPSKGYGNKQMGPIPPNSTLEFEIQLMRIQ